MSRVRYRLKEPFGKAGLVVGVIALVMALVGGAYAAGKLTGPQKKEVEKIAKKYAGKPGAPGAAGTPGTNGTNGKDGANGVGTAGIEGADGKSVTAKAIPASGAGSATCQSHGGTEFEVEGSAHAEHVCNGKEGSPWTAGGTLPANATETGAFASTPARQPEGLGWPFGFARLPISFPIPLAQTLEQETSFLTGTCTEPEGEACPIQTRKPGYDGTDATGASHEQCPGTTTEPKAAPGYLCVYVGSESDIAFERPFVVSPAEEPTEAELKSFAWNEKTTSAGAELMVFFEFRESNPPPYISGTWAVTAE